MNQFDSSSQYIPVPCQTMQVDMLTVQVYESAEEVALAGSAIARQILSAALADTGAARAIFATGRSQVKFLSHLTSPNEQPSLNWSSITGFHLDEYLGIAADHPASFRRYLNTHLTSKVTLGQWHDIEGDGLLPLNICQRYEEQLRISPVDLCCLGIGNNGHLAFNDPAVANFTDPHWVKIVRLDEQNRLQQAQSSAFESIEAVPQYAFTLTLSAIQSVRHSLCLVYGESKSTIVNRLLAGSIHPSCPASVLRKTPQAKLITDRAAAGLFLAAAKRSDHSSG